jgi:hypothetical protein
MPKAYWVSQFSEVHDLEKLAAYAAPAIEAARRTLSRAGYRRSRL